MRQDIGFDNDGIFLIGDEEASLRVFNSAYMVVYTAMKEKNMNVSTNTGQKQYSGPRINLSNVRLISRKGR